MRATGKGEARDTASVPACLSGPCEDAYGCHAGCQSPAGGTIQRPTQSTCLLIVTNGEAQFMLALARPLRYQMPIIYRTGARTWVEGER